MRELFPPEKREFLKEHLIAAQSDIINLNSRPLCLPESVRKETNSTVSNCNSDEFPIKLVKISGNY